MEVSPLRADPRRARSVARLRYFAGRPARLTGYTASVLIGLAVWQFVCELYFSPVLFPPPSVVLPKLVSDLATGVLNDDIGISLFRILSGFAIGSVIGALLGLIMGHLAVFRILGTPWLNFLRFIPGIALLSPFIVWFGIGEVAKVLLIVYVTIFIIAINTISGVESISVQKYRAARCFGAGSWQVFWTVTFPGALWHILTGMRLAMTMSFGTVVAAELVAADSGIGFVINQARIFLDPATIFVGIIILGALGFIADAAIVVLQKTVFRHFATEST